MAGDWIKMRQELFTHPKFMSLYAWLTEDDPVCGLLVYACGDSFGPSEDDPPNIAPLSIALRSVTENALRDITMAALLRVWCAVNAHCKVHGFDAVMSPMTLADVDSIARITGFGSGMFHAGWLVDGRERKSLLFPNFLEHNEPACCRKPPLTNAERQRLFRERHSGVTKNNGSNDREEKNIKNPYSPQKRKPQKPTETTSEDFEKFWQAFPPKRRKDRPAARRAWDKAITKATPATIIDAAAAYAASDEGRGEFVRMPATWLNAEGWTDDRATWSGKAPRAKVYDDSRPLNIKPFYTPSGETA